MKKYIQNWILFIKTNYHVKEDSPDIVSRKLTLILLLFTLLILSYYFGAKYTSLTVKIEYLRGNISETEL